MGGLRGGVKSLGRRHASQVQTSLRELASAVHHGSDKHEEVWPLHKGFPSQLGDRLRRGFEDCKDLALVRQLRGLRVPLRLVQPCDSCLSTIGDAVDKESKCLCH